MLGDPEAVCTRALRAAAARMDAVGEVSVLLTNDVEMRELNVQWRGIDKATDVLSFPYSGSGIPGQPRPLGDIALGLETAKRDADLMERAFEAHVSHLLVHGFLHLLGYDHIESADAAVMEPLEAGILAGLGWPDPYRTGPYGETD
ncbi:MAG: rRNA maturation RNase YbeY [Alphaproteobacteria bacterium]|nr:rRNA maturation RNase YbeY [Alphaproteobacteria bacterium]